MDTALAKQTISRLKQARLTRDTVSLPEVIKLIEELCGRAFSIPIPELADLIGHDTLVTVRVLQAANTFGYNPSGLPVTTVSQAIHIVGFNKIRNLALSMLLLDDAAQGAHPEGRCESAALSLCSGLFAQALGRISPAVDPEQAFVFGCLRHYGRLLLTTFFPDEFARILQRASEESEAAACQRIFGLSLLALTHHVLEESNLPRPILRCLQDLTPQQLASRCDSPEKELPAITQFSAALSELTLSPRLKASGFAQQADQLRNTFERRLCLSADAVPSLVATVDREVKEFVRAYGSRAIATGVLQRIDERVRQLDPTPIDPCEAGASPIQPSSLPSGAEPDLARHKLPPLSDTERPSGNSVGLDAATVLTDCLVRLANLAAAAPIDLLGMERVATTAIWEALRLRDCVLFVRDGNSNRFVARAGEGVLMNKMNQQPIIDSDRRDVFGLALCRCEDLLIQDTTEPRLQPFLPDWLSSAGQVDRVLALTMKGERGAAGILIGTRAGGPPIQLSPGGLRLLKAIRQHLVAARRLALLDGPSDP